MSLLTFVWTVDHSVANKRSRFIRYLHYCVLCKFGTGCSLIYSWDQAVQHPQTLKTGLEHLLNHPWRSHELTVPDCAEIWKASADCAVWPPKTKVC